MNRAEYLGKSSKKLYENLPILDSKIKKCSSNFNTTHRLRLSLNLIQIEKKCHTLCVVNKYLMLA